MQIKIESALISVFSKDGLEPIVQKLKDLGVTIYSTGGTYKYITDLGIDCIKVEDITGYPSILGGRVKTLHPAVFGGILARRELSEDQSDMKDYKLPYFDLVIVDLYPFSDTVKTSTDSSEIIEKIDIGGVSLIRAAAKNFKYTTCISSLMQYKTFYQLLEEKKGFTDLSDREKYAIEAFGTCAEYDIDIYNWMSRDIENKDLYIKSLSANTLRYGENPHQEGIYYGQLKDVFEQLSGKAISYNNLVDIDAALDLICDFDETCTFAVIKHTNACGIATRKTVLEAWQAAQAGDPESAFGGVLVSNSTIDKEAAEDIHNVFCEVIIAPGYESDALDILSSKKNRILISYHSLPTEKTKSKSILNGVIVQGTNNETHKEWNEMGAYDTTPRQKDDLIFANKIVKHLKSNAIALVKNKQLCGKGAGQTSRIDALRHAIEKAHQFDLDLQNAVMASDAFFPFDDCVKIAKKEGIDAVIEPGGSIRDKDTIKFCKENNMALVMTGTRHFKH